MLFQRIQLNVQYCFKVIKLDGMITGGSKEVFLFSKAFTLALQSTQPPLQRVLGALLPGVK
jgi:hypothetical protein